MDKPTMHLAERHALLDQFRSSHHRLLALVSRLSHSQWHFRPAPDRWSIADCLEHVTAVEARVLAAIHKQLEGPADPSKRALTEGKDAAVRQRIPDRSNRIEAPEPVRPTGRWPETAELLAQYQATRNRTIQFVTDTVADLRSRSWPHIALGDLDCYQWLLAMSHHGDRHALQIQEIQQHPDYPAT